jgi:hypothetical protein
MLSLRTERVVAASPVRAEVLRHLRSRLARAPRPFQPAIARCSAEKLCWTCAVKATRSLARGAEHDRSSSSASGPCLDVFHSPLTLGIAAATNAVMTELKELAQLVADWCERCIARAVSLSRDRVCPYRPNRSRACTVCGLNRGTSRQIRAIGRDHILAPLE